MREGCKVNSRFAFGLDPYSSSGMYGNSLSDTNLKSVYRVCDENALGENIGASEENALGEEVGNIEENVLGEEGGNNDTLGEDVGGNDEKALGEEEGNKEDALGEDGGNNEDARRLDKLLENSLEGCFGFKDSPQHEHVFGSIIPSFLLLALTFFSGFLTGL